ncbi:MAG: DUF1700 domain-containing protein [Clostridia bacterium]|nr:DUF1700 domain-containing protein [Clostridia bacterium]
MNKEQFLIELASALAGLPEEDIEKSLEFYSEMIDDRIEEGLTEEESVAEIGSIDEIRAQIIKDTPLPKIIKEKVKPKRSFRGWEIAVMIIGFPLWFPLLIAAAAVIFSVYVTLWSLIIVLFAVEACFVACAFAGIVATPLFFVMGNTPSALFLLGGGLFFAGLSVLWIFVCKWGVRGIIWLTRVFFKSLFIGKEKKQ